MIPKSVVFVGGGPRTVSLVERMAAGARFDGPAVELHLVDPFPPGGGRIWRQAQSPLLWMNSTAADVTLFTDSSVDCSGPVVPGPSLSQWLADPVGHVERRHDVGPDGFASRVTQARYLAWVLARAVSSLPHRFTAIEHRTSAVDVTDLPDGRQRVTLADGAQVKADIVVLAQGYLDRRPAADQADLLAAAASLGLRYTPPGHTADLDFTHLRAGQPVLVRGFGLAFVDLMVLLNEGRGGRFEAVGNGLRYQPSGREPVLYVGSRRGVPYHAKLGYRRDAGPVALRYLTPTLVELWPDEVDYRAQIWPLIVKELAHAHYRELFARHPTRTAGSWTRLLATLDARDAAGPEFRDAVDHAVRDPADRFDIAAVDRPFHGRRFTDLAAWEAELEDHIAADLARRADPRFSADAAVFDALLGIHHVLTQAVAAGRVSSGDRIREVEGTFQSLFSFLASGPPPRRLHELLALHRAGLIRFLGPDTTVEVDHRAGAFVASSPAVPGQVLASALVDAYLPRTDVRAATDPLVRSLLRRGELDVERLRNADGTEAYSGQLSADAQARAVRSDGSVHPRRFLAGPSVAGSAGAAGFARPGYNGPGFRQNDRIARHLLDLVDAPPLEAAPGPWRPQHWERTA